MGHACVKRLIQSEIVREDVAVYIGGVENGDMGSLSVFFTTGAPAAENAEEKDREAVEYGERSQFRISVSF
jgi:hypothetical protein